jgi:biotin carboxyl carrier protein
VYSYSLLLLVANFVGNVSRSYSPEWGFVFGLAVGYRIFRSRIHTLVRFMHTVYLDKKERVLSWFSPSRASVAGVVALVLLLLPVWRESVRGRFYLEPAKRAVLRAKVTGIVTAVYADEGQRVQAGTPLMTLTNPKLETNAALATAEYRVAGARSTQALLRYDNYGSAEQQRQHMQVLDRARRNELEELQITSPISGRVLTPRVHDLIGCNIEQGKEVAEVADMTTMLARIYVPESQVRTSRTGAPARLLFDSSFRPVSGVIESVSPISSEIAAGLIATTSYKGIRQPNFYICVIRVENREELLYDGLPGTAQIYGQRRSLARILWEDLRDFIARKLW